MKSERAVTLMSLAIYIILVLITIAILATITSNFQNNVKDINEEGTEISEINNFNMYFLQEVKKQGNNIKSISNNEITFSSGNKYIYKDKGIYLESEENGTSLKIVNNIASCKFSTKMEIGKTIIVVKIRPNNTKEKTNEYVLNNEQIASDYDDETNYINGLTRDISLPDGWEITTKPDGWNDDEIPITDGENIVPLPDGYEVSDADGEHTIEEGLVIKDRKGNEFVWIPVTENFATSYKGLVGYSEPTVLTGNNTEAGAPQVAYDSQETLDYYYGTGYYSFKTDFAYGTHYAEMVKSVNKYKGFYIGRYETTINEFSEVGSKLNTTVLTAKKTTPQLKNKECRWWGLYSSQRNSNVVGNKRYVQTNMIWGQQWDAMIKQFDKLGKDYSKWVASAQGRIVSSGQSVNSSGAKDKIYNIYDLRTNGYDWIAEANIIDNHTLRGGYYFISFSASNRIINFPTNNSNDYASRLTLYLK